MECGERSQWNGVSRIQLRGHIKLETEKHPLCLTTNSSLTWSYFFVIWFSIYYGILPLTAIFKIVFSPCLFFENLRNLGWLCKVSKIIKFWYFGWNFYSVYNFAGEEKLFYNSFLFQRRLFLCINHENFNHLINFHKLTKSSITQLSLRHTHAWNQGLS